uniref:Uncharacterized protein n=1 Tax=Daphnia galeata TaxID=27404 RepID=A0A8J2S177_9CRUS|nr:unnamed protein product [Daphnia galeata]
MDFNSNIVIRREINGLLPSTGFYMPKKFLIFQRIPITIWSLIAVAIGNAYSGSLTSFLTVPKLKTTINYLEELANNNEFKLTAEINTADADKFLRAISGYAQILGDSLRNNPHLLFRNYTEATENVLNNNAVYLRRYVLIRPFTQGDEIECKKIAGFTVMSTVNRTFFSALFRETTFQLMVFLSAVLFIIVGLPFFYCAVSVPLTVTFLYSAIWSSAMMKSLEIQNELSLVKQQYQESSDKTTFLVAEYYGPLLDLNPGENITFISISSFQGLEDELFNKSKRVHHTFVMNEDTPQLKPVLLNASKRQKNSFFTINLN